MSLNSYNLHSLRKRILACIMLVSVLFFALVIRLFYVQVLQNQRMQALAEDQWTRSLTISAPRGTIYDSNGSTLAYSYSTYSLYTRAKEIKNKVEVAEFLSKTLNSKFANIYEKVSNKSISEVLIQLQVQPEDALKILEKKYAGVYFTENSSRYYPYGNLATQVLGFTTIDNIGQAGIESYYNDLLKGTNGYYLVQSDLIGISLEDSLEYYTTAQAGNNVTLTIDANIQKLVEQALDKAMVEQSAKSATCIVMKADTGEVVAMSTKPSYDLNDIPRDDVASLMEMTKNKSAVDVYEPGSTFKIITMAAAVDCGAASLSDHFYCSGSCVVDGERIKCWKSIGHGSQTLSEGLYNSCNCVFVALAQRLGTERFYKYLEKFGYGNLTGIEIQSESGGIMMDADLVKSVDLARIGFGQTIAVTPIQQITATCTVVNGGTLYQPYLVKQITDADGNIVVSNSAKVVQSNVISSQTSETLNEMIEGVVSRTGKYMFIPGYSVGGKTGTSQKYENGKISGKYTSSFVGTYPASNPEYVVLFIVDEPGAGAYYGSIVATPYAKEILSGMFEYLGIEPDDPALATAERKSVVMPDLVGLSLTKAVEKLSLLHLNYEIDGEGTKITSQLPPAGTTLSEYDTVVICTN